ncbi:peptidoglycan-binding domain-containing protein [Raineya orbicola]|uniref:Putative peptidoglycan binding domain n=1 Tax=Raineya orbicola TaxID=2016530 RepID=A0A2N3IAT9_9BACT|nr:peptidoglycan-binding protein [Raineya orbicola]PKQ67417.1 putative peptidoglycan binding domain [Raineya orbicola]
MKRIVVFLILVFLGLLTFFQYQKYRKFSYPNAYDYVINTQEIDVNYHEPALVKEYFETATYLGNFAREQWTNYGIDVLSSDIEIPQAKNAAQTYQTMLARVKFLEAKLIHSKKLKQQGFDNEAIAYIEKNGISEKNYSLHKLIAGKTFRKGDKDRAIWEIQKLISQKWQAIQIDGVFSDETEQAIKKIQQEKQSYPSGIIDEDFLKLLLQ